VQKIRKKEGKGKKVAGVSNLQRVIDGGKEYGLSRKKEGTSWKNRASGTGKRGSSRLSSGGGKKSWRERWGGGGPELVFSWSGFDGARKRERESKEREDLSRNPTRCAKESAYY